MHHDHIHGALTTLPGPHLQVLPIPHCTRPTQQDGQALDLRRCARDERLALPRTTATPLLCTESVVIPVLLETTTTTWALMVLLMLRIHLRDPMRLISRLN